MFDVAESGDGTVVRKRKEKKKVQNTAESLLVGESAAFVLRQNPFVDGDRAEE